MDEPNPCERCGDQTPPAGDLGGRCPRCLLELGLASLPGRPDNPDLTISPTIHNAAVRSAAIGHYRIVRLIGEGGMGAVYLAEQEQPRRTVALKVIKPGLASPELLRRFEQESQALGRLQHPGIAQIHEAGTADTGFGPQPYFAMEHIRGASVREYAEAHRLSVRERLEMLAKVAEAVHHAHQRGLIHRDLKPSNILVDETGQPKILDFGVARVTDQDAQATMHTDVGQLVGTLAYMSPEQVLADPQALDARSDVYALGVILYELLAGRLPYQISKKLHEAIHAIREEDPARLSTVNRTYRGDIETIAARALEKDKTRRYASAAELAADIRRYLKDEPILARPPSTSYQLRKFARRHKALVGGVAAVFVVLIGGIVVSTWQAVRASRAEQGAVLERDRAVQAEGKTRVERDRATAAEQTATTQRDRALNAERQATSERNRAVSAEGQARQEAATAQALNEFLRKDLLAVANPTAQVQAGQLDAKPDPNLTVRKALDQAAARIAGKFEKQPVVEAALRETIGGTYLGLGLYAEGQQQLERALELRTKVQGTMNRDTLLAMSTLAGVYNRLGRRAEAEELLKKVVEGQSRTLGDADPVTLANMISLATLYMNRNNLTDAEAIFMKALNRQRRPKNGLLGLTVMGLANLVKLYRVRDKAEQAGELLSKLDAVVQALGEGNPAAKAVRSMVQSARGDWTQAGQPQVVTRTFPAIENALPAPDDESVLDVLRILNQGLEYRSQGKYAEAEALLTRGLNAARHLMGKENTLTLRMMRTLAETNLIQRQFGPAEELSRELWDIQRSTRGEDALETLSTMTLLADLYKRMGNPERALEMSGQRLDIQRRALGRQDQEAPATRVFTMVLAQEYTGVGRYGDAEELLTPLLEIQRRKLGNDQQEPIPSTMWLLGWTKVHRQKYTEAEVLLRQALDVLKITRPDNWLRYNCESILGASLTGQKHYEEAERWLLSGYDGMATREPPAANANIKVGSILQGQAGERIIQLYQSWGKPEKAAEWRQKLQTSKTAVPTPRP